MGSISVALLGPGPLFSKVQIINRLESCFSLFTFYFERGVNSFADNMTKLSVNKTKGAD